ncbi:uncharacterized protein [Lolium perenne]|uniref:uncharacterized protein n=1 Tax=Lolium perenne TaxID=4522 RepID=UPI0021F6488C|nr:uncharacterized protein LOC127295423 [Lolium perenne]
MTINSVAISSILDHCKSLQQLWFACAGSGVTVPQVGELVFYFPQGHLGQDGGISMHLHGVPSQILCRVINVELKSENDFVHACLILLPEQAELNHGFEAIDSKCLPSSTPRLSAYFCKKLRAADTMAHAWFSIPRKHAEKFLPPLDMAKMAPIQELVVKDLSGMEWHFQHRLVGPRRHLLQTAEYATSKNLVAGDVIVILRGEDGQLHVGVRRCMRSIGNMPPSEVTSNEGHKTGLGILPSISHAITARSIFTVIYRPRTGTGQFVVPYDRYVESGKICSVGTRFRMIFREATTERRVSGIISGFEDFDATWPDSKWRCLKVKLNKDSSVAIPERVSPWEIEPHKRSSNAILTYLDTKKPSVPRGLFREDSRQEATILATHNPSCVDPEACLNNAKYIFQLCQDGSLTHASSSLVENRIFLGAVDALICLSVGSSSRSFSSVDDLRIQTKEALDIAMSELARTFHGLKLWNVNHFKDLDSLPSTMSKLCCPSALDSLCLSSTSSDPVSSSSLSTGASSRNSELMPAEDCSTFHRVMSCLDEKKFDLINQNSISSVRSIASRMIQAGFTERLRETFTDLSQELIRDFHILDSNWIFQCHSRVDEGDSCVGESVRLQYWNLASQFITRVLVEMRRQLSEADLGAFDELKGDYFAKIVEQPVSKLLNVASTLAALNKLLEEIPQGLVQCVQTVFPRIVHALSTYSTLSDVVPTLLELVSPDSRESISREAEAIRKKVEDVVSRMLDILTDAMSASSLPEAEDTDVHPVTKAVAEGTGSLLEHRDSLNLILAHSCCQVYEGVPAIESYNSLISGLIVHLQSVLRRSCKGPLQKESRYIFLLNNMQFILNQFKSSAMEDPIGHGDWAIEHHKAMEHYMKEYIETSWAPVSSHLAAKDGKHLRFWRHSSVQQFTAAFQCVCAKQRHWKVPDPHLRKTLRASISRKLVPAYCEYLGKHPKGSKSIRITREELEDLLSELFEG